MNTSPALDNIIHTATQFANSCRVVAEAVKDGTVERSKASAGKDTIKLSTQVKANHGLDGESLRDLKASVKRHNAGHAFQEAFGVSLASLAEQARTLKGILDLDTGTAGAREAAPADAGKRNGKVATAAA